MTADPLDALRGPDHPTDPDPAFAAALRARLVRALTTGDPVTTTTTAPSNPVNGVRQGDVSYATLQVPDLAAAQAFYGAVLGWTFAPGRLEQGSHVLGTAPMIGIWGDPGHPRVGATLAYRVFDIEAAVERVRAGGGEATDVEPESYGLSSVCSDPSRLRFWLNQMGDEPVLPKGARLRTGDVSYVTFGMADGDRDRDFYASVLGWSYAEGNPDGLLPMTGVWSPGERRGDVLQDDATHQLGAVLCYQVDDIVAAVERVRDAGGRADDPVRRPYGLESHGYDDQGVEFYLHQLDQD